MAGESTRARLRLKKGVGMTVDELPNTTHELSEYDALLAAPSTALDAIPGAVYICDADGWLVRYNSQAAQLWGRTPRLPERFCGSYRLFLPGGAALPHDQCPMATAVQTGRSTRNAEVVIERPDGSRVTALVNIQALKDRQGRVQGAINCFQDVTREKALEAEAYRKSADLEDFFENSAIGLHIVNSSGIIERANRAELNLLGYSAEEYVGRHVGEFHVDQPVIEDILHRLSCGKQLDRYPARLRAKDGSIRHVLITSNSRFDEGQFVNTRCFTMDVTGLYEAESARRDSENRLAATYEAATVGIAEADSRGRLLRVNDAVCKMLGRSREELLSMSVFDYTHPDDRDNDASLYARQVKGELENYSLRKRASKPNGEVVHLDVHSSSVRDQNGKFRYGVRVIQDVTETKRMEDRLRDGERHLRNLLEALPAAVYTTDAHGRIDFFNKAAVEMAGRKPEPGDHWCVTWRLRYPDGTPLPHDQCPMAVALKEDRPIRGVEAIAERPDGTLIPFIPFPTPLHDAEGRLIGGINMLVDITERKKAEDRQKVLIDELNHRVKNTLATIQSLASQTARHASDLTDFSERFETRLLSLSRAHDLLTKRHWEGAPLLALAEEVLSPITGSLEGQRVALLGPQFDLDARTALNLTTVLNELATNAVKYGSLSAEAGTITLSWQVATTHIRVLTMEWRESGGPPVKAPSRRGVGTRLMQLCIERDMGGDLEVVFDPAGLLCRMAIPLSPAIQ